MLCARSMCHKKVCPHVRTFVLNLVRIQCSRRELVVSCFGTIENEWLLTTMPQWQTPISWATPQFVFGFVYFYRVNCGTVNERRTAWHCAIKPTYSVLVAISKNKGKAHRYQESFKINTRGHIDFRNFWPPLHRPRKVRYCIGERLMLYEWEEVWWI